MNSFNYSNGGKDFTGFEIDTQAHAILDDKIDGFTFGHGLGHGIGINVHEVPPNLSQNEIAKAPILDGMTFTIEPGMYNPKHFGVRLENSCYKKDGKIHSFVKMGYEGKLINYDLLTEQEKTWLKENLGVNLAREVPDQEENGNSWYWMQHSGQWFNQ